MNTEQILEMWKNDGQIDELKLDDTTIRMARIHSKYLELLTIAKMTRKKYDLEYKTLLKDKWLYYNGKMSGDDIVANGWEYDPFHGLKVLKGEMDYYYNADTDIQKSIEKLEYWKTVISTLSEIVSNINWRHQTIGNMIKWKTFEAGG
jgi:hypothetical protein